MADAILAAADAQGETLTLEELRELLRHNGALRKLLQHMLSGAEELCAVLPCPELTAEGLEESNRSAVILSVCIPTAA